jgi:hypothetical protein
LTAASICSAGGVDSRKGNVQPEPVTDCPAIPDPLAGRKDLTLGSCDYDEHEISSGTHTLHPGVYCKGLTIKDAKVTLSPGIYVIRDGELKVEEGAELIGAEASFYFYGDAASFDFEDTFKIELSATRTGKLAGFLFFADREPGRNERRYRIRSNAARKLLGTIYLPGGELEVAASSPIADQSDFTMIVADRVEVSEGPVLTLNTNYAGSPVPVPEGVGPRRASAYLAQ